MNIMTCKTFLLTFILTIMPFLSGCSAYINRPVHTLGAWALLSKMEEHRGVAVTAEKRLVMEKKRTGNSDFIICAEPSPDVAQSILSMFKITADWGKEKDLSSTELASLFSAIPFPLIVRSQGLQFHRDSVFALCQMAMNEWIGNKDGFCDKCQIANYNHIINIYNMEVSNYNKMLNEYNEAVTKYNNCVEKNGEADCEKQTKLIKPEKPEEPQEPVFSEIELALRGISRDAKEIIIEEVRNGSLYYPILIKQYEQAMKFANKALDLYSKNQTEQQNTITENTASQQSSDGTNPQTDSATNSTVITTP